MRVKRCKLAPSHKPSKSRQRRLANSRAEAMDGSRVSNPRLEESDFLACCGSARFAREMAAAAPFANCEQAIRAARDIWMNKVDVNGWLEAFAAHPQIGGASSASKKNETSAQWSKGEQSTALATATNSSLQELLEWNAWYRQKFGFVFLICASGRSTPEILAELKKRYPNRPIVELEVAGQEQMKITELRLAKLFESKVPAPAPPTSTRHPASLTEKAEEDRLSVIGAHLTAGARRIPAQAPFVTSVNSSRTRPPITTHVLDVSRGCPASGIEVHLEMWKGTSERPSFGANSQGEWVFRGSSVTNSDGRCIELIEIVDNIPPGFYRLSFNTGKYSPNGFYPYVSITFEIRESQGSEHFHVPLLFSPYSFSTYRGS